MKFNIYNNVLYDEILNDKLVWGGDYMEEWEDVRDFCGRLEFFFLLFLEGFFFFWNDWLEKDRFFFDELFWLVILNDLIFFFSFWIYIRKWLLLY